MTVAQSDMRLFYALWPDSNTVEHLVERQKRLGGKHTHPTDFHMTLAFLGAQPTDLLPRLLAIARNLAQPKLSMVLDRYGCFNRHGIVWAGMSAIPHALLKLQSELVHALAQHEVSYSPEVTFVPHVTLARKATLPDDTMFEPVMWQDYQLVLAQSRAATQPVYGGDARYRILNEYTRTEH